MIKESDSCFNPGDVVCFVNAATKQSLLAIHDMQTAPIVLTVASVYDDDVVAIKELGGAQFAAEVFMLALPSYKGRPCTAILANTPLKNDVVAFFNDTKEIFSIRYDTDIVDWTTVQIDTPILVRTYPADRWDKRHFAGYDAELGQVYAFNNGGTSWTTEDSTLWDQAMLAK